MKRVHIVGRKNAGKTTLVVELVGELTRRGHRVGTIKHTHHPYELDTPGKDSYRHRAAGAEPATVVAGDRAATYVHVPAGEPLYERFAPWYAACDVVIVEGDAFTAAPTVEVWRKDVVEAPIASAHEGIEAVISDDPVDLRVPKWPRCDVGFIADQLLALCA